MLTLNLYDAINAVPVPMQTVRQQIYSFLEETVSPIYIQPLLLTCYEITTNIIRHGQISVDKICIIIGFNAENTKITVYDNTHFFGQYNDYRLQFKTTSFKNLYTTKFIGLGIIYQLWPDALYQKNHATGFNEFSVSLSDYFCNNTVFFQPNMISSYKKKRCHA